MNITRNTLSQPVMSSTCPLCKVWQKTTCIGMYRNWGCCETRSQFRSSRRKFEGDMASWNHIKLYVKKIWERTFHMCSKRTRVRAHFSPTMIGLVKYQCTSSSQLPPLWACKPCHIIPHNWLFHTHQNFPDPIGICWVNPENTLKILLSRPEFLLPIIIHGCTSVPALQSSIE